MAQHFFQRDQLTVNGGSIRFTVADNSPLTDTEKKSHACQIIGNVGRQRLSKHLSVDLLLNFEPFTYHGETLRCSMAVNNIPWKSAYRHWWQLVGMNRKIQNGEDGIEGVFYADKPYIAGQIEYSLHYIRENLFELAITLLLDGEDDSQRTVQGKAIVPFEGVFIGNGFSYARTSHEIEMSVFEPTPSTDEQGIEYYKPRWDNLGHWMLWTVISQPPECLSEFEVKSIPIDDIGLEPAMDCTAYALACPCGAERLDILYHQCPDDPQFEGIVLDPISARCLDCGREAVLFDSTKDGYNAKIESVTTRQGTSDTVVWECPSCQSPGRVIVVYSHVWDDDEEIPEDIADWFDWFTLKHQCTESHELHDVGDWECAWKKIEQMMKTDKNVAYTREYQAHRREFDSVFESPGERQKTIVLAQGKYFVDVSHHRQRKILKKSEEELNLAVARLIVRDGENNMIAEIKSIDDHDYIGLVEHRNGLDYLVYRIDLYGYSVMEIETGKTVDYIPESSFTGGEETFIWGDTKYCPVNNLLVVDGCYWACPYGFEFYDFSNPMELPLPLYGNSYDIEKKRNTDIVAGVENIEFDENGNCCMKIENTDHAITINPLNLAALLGEK